MSKNAKKVFAVRVRYFAYRTPGTVPNTNHQNPTKITQNRHLPGKECVINIKPLVWDKSSQYQTRCYRSAICFLRVWFNILID